MGLSVFRVFRMDLFVFRVGVVLLVLVFRVVSEWVC